MHLKLPTALSAAALSISLAAGGAAFAESSAPPAAKPPPRSCFRNQDVWSWAPQDKRTVNLKVHLHDYYQLKLAIECGDIDWSQHIALQSRGSNWICSGSDVVVIAPSSIGPQRCMATDLRKLTPEEVAALPRNAKP